MTATTRHRATAWSELDSVDLPAGTVRVFRRPGVGEHPLRLTCVHGFEESWRSWRPLAEQFPLAQIDSLDLPWRSGNDYGWVHDGSSLTWLARALELGRPHGGADVVVAHSFGAATLLELLATGYSGVTAAALIAPIFRPRDVGTDPDFFAEAMRRSRGVLHDGLVVELGERARRLSPVVLARMHRAVVERVEPHGL